VYELMKGTQKIISLKSNQAPSVCDESFSTFL
jgi:hypothetical protein